LDGCCITFRIWAVARSIYARKTTVPALIKEIYDFLRQADAIELNDLFRRLEKEKCTRSN
jgi:isocitrate lyase